MDTHNKLIIVQADPALPPGTIKAVNPDGSTAGILTNIEADIGKHIICAEVSLQNRMGKPKVVARVVPEGVFVWCMQCRQDHLIKKEVCESIWAKGTHYRVTCALNNDFGREKLVAKIVSEKGSGAILNWCRYCHVAHRVTREECLTVWSKTNDVQ